MGLLQIQTHRRKDSAATSCHLAEDVEGFHPTVKRLGKLEKSTKGCPQFFLRNPRAFNRMDILRFTPKNWIVNWVKIPEMSEIKWKSPKCCAEHSWWFVEWWGFLGGGSRYWFGGFLGSKPMMAILIGDGHQPNSGGFIYACYKDFRWKVGRPSPI